MADETKAADAGDVAVAVDAPSPSRGVREEDGAAASGSPVEQFWKKVDKESCGYGTVVVVTIITVLSLMLPSDKVTTRQYFISAEEVEWDYAPSGMDMCGGGAFMPGSDGGGLYAAEGNGTSRVGSTYTKARFVGYTDATFTEPLAIEAKWEHLGLLGPVIRAEVGDLIQVTFRNRARNPVSLFPSGVGTSKANEGAHYSDGTIDGKQRDDYVSPFGTQRYNCPDKRSTVPLRERQKGCRTHEVLPSTSFTYEWHVTEAAGPGSDDPSSVVWLYRSHHDDSGEDDLHAGLMGPIIITRKGSTRSADDPSPSDVDQEFVMFMAVANENESPYFESNVQKRIVSPLFAEDGVPHGYVPFARADKARVLQALVEHASSALTSLSYTDAVAMISGANAAQVAVGHVSGASINVYFGSESFDPTAYDAANGGRGTAREIVESLVSSTVPRDDPGFVESNMMHHINGYIFCGQPGLTTQEGNVVRWHLLTLGDAGEAHSAHWQGHTGVMNNHRVDSVPLFPGSAETVDMTMDNRGTWLFHCHVDEHLKGGMASLFSVANGTAVSTTSSGITREYFIAADEVAWDYAPGNIDSCAGGVAFDPDSVAAATLRPAGVESLGTNVTKAIYRAYTDATFTTLATSDANLGMLGPVIRAEVGDTIVVNFKNNARFPFNMHAHGVTSSKLSEGMQYQDGANQGAGDSVAPGGTFTYTWEASPTSGPASGDATSTLWLYHSAVDQEADTNAGLVGPIVIYATGQMEASTVAGFDWEQVYLFFAVDESASKYAEVNIADKVLVPAANGGSPEPATAAAAQRLLSDPRFRTNSLRHSINGRAACSLPAMTYTQGESVRWYLLSLGNQGDVHAPTWQGHALMQSGRNVATVGLLPASTVVADTMFLHAGTWEIADQVAEHFSGGARTTFSVLDSAVAAPMATGGQERQYFIAADEVDWNYAPSGRNLCTNTEFDEIAMTYMTTGHHRVGSTYRKAVYREYEDAEFKRLKWGDESRFTEGSEHLGILGPLIRANVGDTVKITFQNNLPGPASLAMLGGPLVGSVVAVNELQTEFAAAGGAGVRTGGQVEITVAVTSEAGPGAGDSSTVAWSYGSDVDLVRDTHSGLVGVFVVTQVDAGGKGGRAVPSDVNREFVALWTTFDENLSRYAKQNAFRFAQDAETIDFSDDDFLESNRMSSVNGRMYCNLGGLSVRQKQDVRFYMLAGSQQGHVYTPSINGHSFADANGRVASVNLYPGIVRVVDLGSDFSGRWLGRGGIGSEEEQGMAIFFEVNQVIEGRPD